MIAAQAVADLALLLTSVTTVEQADTALKRALRSTGLLNAPTMDAEDIQRLIVALAAEGGPIEQLAVHIAVHGIDGTDGMPRR